MFSRRRQRISDQIVEFDQVRTVIGLTFATIINLSRIFDSAKSERLIIPLNMYGRNNVFSNNTNHNTNNNLGSNGNYGSNSSFRSGTKALGSYRLEYRYEQPASYLSSYITQWKEQPPSSIVARQQTLHLTTTQLRIEDYYIIRKKQLKPAHQTRLKDAIRGECFNQEIVNYGFEKLPPVSEERPLDLDVLRNVKTNQGNSQFSNTNVNSNDRNRPNIFSNGSSSNVSHNVFSQNSNNRQGNTSNSNHNSGGFNNSGGFTNSGAFNNPNSSNSAGNIFSSGSRENSGNGNMFSNSSGNNTGQNLRAGESGNMGSSNNNIFSNRNNPGNNQRNNNGSSNNITGNRNNSMSNNNIYNSNTNYSNNNNNNNNNNSNGYSNNSFNNNGGGGNNMFGNDRSGGSNFSGNNASGNNNGISSEILLSLQYALEQNVKIMQSLQQKQSSKDETQDQTKNEISPFDELANRSQPLDIDHFFQSSKKVDRQQTIVFVKPPWFEQYQNIRSSHVQSSFRNSKMTINPVSALINNPRFISDDNNRGHTRINPTESRMIASNKSPEMQHLLKSSLKMKNGLQTWQGICICQFDLQVEWQDDKKKQMSSQKLKFTIQLQNVKPEDKGWQKQAIRKMKKSNSLVRIDADLLIAFCKERDLSTSAEFVLKGTLRQKIINLSECYRVCYSQIRNCMLYNLTISNECGSINWKKPINAKDLDFVYTDDLIPFHIGQNQLICQLKALNSQCTVHFIGLPQHVGKDFQVGDSKKNRELRQKFSRFVSQRSNGAFECFQMWKTEDDSGWGMLVKQFPQQQLSEE